MIRAIIFDCFGVLSTDAWHPFKHHQFGHDSTLLQEAGDLRKQVDAGLSGYREFLERLAELSGLPVQKVHAELERNAPNEQVFDYISHGLKPRYKIGLLSNAARNRLDELFGAENTALFDAVALSYETGTTKPDARAYQIIAERLGVEPAECIFVDDQARYCAAAEQTGMKSIVYADYAQFRAEIDKLLAADSE